MGESVAAGLAWRRGARPREIEACTRADRLRHGVELDAETRRQLIETAAALGVPSPDELRSAA